MELPAATWGYLVAPEILIFKDIDAGWNIYAGWGHLMATKIMSAMSMLAGATWGYLRLPGATRQHQKWGYSVTLVAKEVRTLLVQALFGEQLKV